MDPVPELINMALALWASFAEGYRGVATLIVIAVILIAASVTFSALAPTLGSQKPEREE